MREGERDEASENKTGMQGGKMQGEIEGDEEERNRGRVQACGGEIVRREGGTG